ncbi:hypothetical protein H5410_021632 [Solanum commersonii]|uniref:Uncharacterized protein n=1 Tax=Solanum commersonii TaxID=4109 RepID=A0A9J5ZEI3_SOLCO|nr:hypothetical protein H5410_021632 [Solanum commersonii]
MYFFLDFSAILRHIRNIRAITKRSKVLFFYSSQYSKLIGAITERSKVLFCIRHDILRSLVQLFWGIYVIFDHFRAVTKRSKVLIFYSSRYSKVINLRKEVKFCSFIRHDILSHFGGLT